MAAGDDLLTLVELVAEQRRCNNTMANTVKFPDAVDRYLEIQKEINVRAGQMP